METTIVRYVEDLLVARGLVSHGVALTGHGMHTRV